jgi:predicted O-methyltransferase YrrM
MKNYIFTEKWFNDDGFDKITKLTKNSKLDFLEIGSFEGRSTIWFLDVFLQDKNSTITCIDPWLNYSQNEDSLNSYGSESSVWKFGETKVKERFLKNITENGNLDKVKIIQELSDKALPILINENKKYDLIFIDGNHVAPYVLMDSVMSWPLLKVGGYMIFDDYDWGLDMPGSFQETDNVGMTLRPEKAIDSFIDIFSDYIEIIYSNHRKIIRRVK